MLKRALMVLIRRRPLTFVALLAVFVLLPTTLLCTSAGSSPTEDDAVEVEDDRAPRALLNRVWFDKYPEKSRDTVRIWIWLAGGIGITERGSFWKGSYELFEFERQGSKIVMVWFQDKKRFETSFKVESCEDQPPFDLCLTLDKAPRGHAKKFYGFGDNDDLAEHVPWATGTMKSARERAASLPRER